MGKPAGYLQLEFTEKLYSQDYVHSRTLPFANSQLYSTTIIEVRILAQGDDVKTTYDIALDIKDVQHDYTPGDAIGILPSNNQLEVQSILERLNLMENADKFYHLTTKKKLPPHLPTQGTIHNLFLNHVDIHSPPKKLFLKSLIEYCNESEDRIKIENLCAIKSDTYNNFITNQGSTLLKLLEHFPSCKPPVERLLEHLPPLLPRYYSIVSSPLIPDKLNVAFSMINGGVCTNHLETSIKNKTEILFYFRKPSNFLKIEPEQPLILIGPGTGVAPFIGFLRDIQLSNKKNASITLYFGCRYSNRDFIYEHEIVRFKENGILDEIYTAFSRDTSQKVYVQDKLLENGEKVVQAVLNANATICLCGDAKNFAKNVENVLAQCLILYGGMEQSEVLDFISELKKLNRFRMDIWI